jgi:predicted PurR-regulated permease PerM
MPEIGRKKSVLLSKILCYVIFVFILACLILIPTAVDYYTEHIQTLPDNLRTAAIVILYASMPPAFIADCFLLRLINNIEKENVFIRANVKNLRYLAWCCFIVGVIYTFAGFYFTTAFVIAFAAYFFFLILHVVKNVFDAAVALKEENDYTI